MSLMMSGVQVLVMLLYTAVRYRNDMSVFDHRTDGIVHHTASATKPASLPVTGPRKTFTASQVGLQIFSKFNIHSNSLMFLEAVVETVIFLM